VAGQDITEDLPLNIGNPGTAGFWTNNAEEYDVAFGGIPFFMAPTDQNPYQRETAPYRKDQFDSAAEPGEQSLTGWWIRSQSSFHCGSGIKFFDPTSGEATKYRFADSQGVDIWTKGQVTLLKDVTENHITTGALDAYNRPNQHVRSIQYGTTNAVLLHDEYDVDKITLDGTVVHYIDYNSGTSEKVYAICDDGVYAYWVTNVTAGGANKLHMFKKPLSGDTTTGVSYPAVTGDVTLMFNATGTLISNAFMEYVKDRIVLCVNGKVYEIAPNATSLPSPIYTHPNSNYIYTSITASGPAIYTSGNAGIQSTIQKYTLGSNGSMPVLTQASVAAEMPPGEIIYRIYYYLGYMMIGTSKGVRAAIVSDQDGSISYGPIITTTSQPCYDFAARDRFVWCATGIDGLDAGLIRIDLSQIVENEPLRFAYANDLQYTQTTTHYTTGVAFFGVLPQLAFCTAYNTTNGHVYREAESTLRSSGYLTTGAIRYGTLEPKNYKFLRARGDYTYGAMDLQSISEDGSIYNVITYNGSIGSPEAATTQPEGAQEFVSYKFTLSRSASGTSQGPIFKGYQSKALPATKRQRLIQFPVWCYDIEKDRFNVLTGYEGRAWERIEILEALEAAGDIVNVQDFTTQERVQAIIEKISFSRKSPPNGSFNGFGGLLLVTVRTVL
jgi:hypothetical protein